MQLLLGLIKKSVDVSIFNQESYFWEGSQILTNQKLDIPISSFLLVKIRTFL